MRALTGRAGVAAIVIVALVAGVLIGRLSGGLGGGGSLASVAEARGMTVAEAEGALKAFTPPGKYDEYVLVSSGGHSGNLHLVGVPSMRLLKTIPVFTPESWSGYGQGADWSKTILDEGSSDKQAAELTWGDTHHPGLSETGGAYDGRWVYINDRANGRLGMVDLRDFKAKQILDIPNVGSSHGGVFVTPDTDYVHISSMTPAPQTANGYAPLEDYQDSYRGMSTWVKIDKATGKGVVADSFQIELPPYTQDLADAGKLASDGFGFINSYNTEMATGGVLEGGEPLEKGASQKDFDYLHIIDWKKAAEVAAAGKTENRNGIRVITLQTAIDEGLLYFAPEPRSPHGVDVSPDGNYISVGGKLDPHVTIYEIGLIKEAIANKDFDGTDPYGVPVLRFDAVVAGQVEVGLGPLHTQYDGKGYGFISLFLDSAVAKFSLGEKAGIAKDQAFKLVDTIKVNYNIGHLATTEGDTVAADGKYLVALNKWSIDRFPVLGTLKPQNFQLIDLSGPKMQLLADMPIGFGEPHYVQIIKTSRLSNAIEIYEPGTDPMTFAKSSVATAAGDERIERDGDEVHVYMTAMRSHFSPDIIRVKKGDHVVVHVTNIEQTPDATHGFAIPGYNIQMSLDPGEVVSAEFHATKTGSFAFYCTEFCSALHLEMQGWLLVEP
ncbi:MAG TPA: Sec-dependent nitrous-oxide reductase [Candidatus Sulfomarinibacteraceae bacterium]|nr:Sec-dependent nitrous-oxide reductase [Candidatus Sulfomarinibacteraceae bacterium]